MFAWREPQKKTRFPLYCYHVFKGGGLFTGRRMETAFLLLLPEFVAVRKFTDKCHNILTDMF
jgi:hypothetical protein